MWKISPSASGVIYPQDPSRGFSSGSQWGTSVPSGLTASETWHRDRIQVHYYCYSNILSQSTGTGRSYYLENGEKRRVLRRMNDGASGENVYKEVSEMKTNLDDVQIDSNLSSNSIVCRRRPAIWWHATITSRRQMISAGNLLLLHTQRPYTGHREDIYRVWHK